jgi:hypothetical protein
MKLLSDCDEAAKDSLGALFYVVDKVTKEMQSDSDKWKQVLADILLLDQTDFSVEFTNLLKTEEI